MDNNETLKDIVAEMRGEKGFPVPFAPMRGIWLSDYHALADRIEAAAIRERSKWEQERRAYEKLHDCFWAEDAIQSIVRQMLDARDDLRRAYPKEADDLQYYAHELIEAAKRRERDAAPGNAAAMRFALADIEFGSNYCIERCDTNSEADDVLRFVLGKILDIVKPALAAPARNCDRCRNTAQALGAYRDGPPIGEEWGAGDWMQLLDWLFATEAKEGEMSDALRHCGFTGMDLGGGDFEMQVKTPYEGAVVEAEMGTPKGGDGRTWLFKCNVFNARGFGWTVSGEFSRCGRYIAKSMLRSMALELRRLYCHRNARTRKAAIARAKARAEAEGGAND